MPQELRGHAESGRGHSTTAGIPFGTSVASLERTEAHVPELSRFYGVVIALYYNDHAPPHFHARYGTSQAALAIRGLSVVEGWLPPRVLGLVVEWATQHRDELLANWVRASRQLPLVPIAPLE
jgi:hypothetical protein